MRRCSSHRTRDHRWPCVQFNCSSNMEQFTKGSAVCRVTGHFSTPPENWTVEHSYNWHRAFQTTLLLRDSLSLSRSFSAVAATLKSIDYNVAMTFVLNNNNNNNNTRTNKQTDRQTKKRPPPNIENNTGQPSRRGGGRGHYNSDAQSNY